MGKRPPIKKKTQYVHLYNYSRKKITYIMKREYVITVQARKNGLKQELGCKYKQGLLSTDQCAKLEEGKAISLPQAVPVMGAASL